MTTPDPRTEQAVAHPAVRVVAEILSARLDLERWERDGWPTVDDDLAVEVAPAFLHWIAGQFEAHAKRSAGAHPEYLTAASGWYSAAAVAGMWADEIEDALDAEAAQRALADPAPSIPFDAVMTGYIPDPALIELVAHELRTTVEGGETVTDAAGRILDAVRSHLEAPLIAELEKARAGRALALELHAAASAAHLETLREFHDARRLADMRLRVIALHREEITASGRVIDAARAWRATLNRIASEHPEDVVLAAATAADALIAALAVFDAPDIRTGPPVATCTRRTEMREN